VTGARWDVTGLSWLPQSFEPGTPHLPSTYAKAHLLVMSLIYYKVPCTNNPVENHQSLAIFKTNNNTAMIFVAQPISKTVLLQTVILQTICCPQHFAHVMT
jgi:hypothetical protein